MLVSQAAERKLDDGRGSAILGSGPRAVKACPRSHRVRPFFRNGKSRVPQWGGRDWTWIDPTRPARLRNNGKRP